MARKNAASAGSPAAESTQPAGTDAPTAAPPSAAAAPVPDPHADIAGLRYEQARDELFDIVARLESGQVGLEESLTLWARGEALAAHCSTWLDQAQAAITSTPPAG